MVADVVKEHRRFLEARFQQGGDAAEEACRFDAPVSCEMILRVSDNHGLRTPGEATLIKRTDFLWMSVED